MPLSEWIDDIDSLNDLSPSVGVSGYIGDIHRALTVLNKPIPQNIDYPIQLRHILGRTLKQTTLKEIRESITPQFIKPDIEHKLFNGFVFDNSISSRRKIVTCSDDTTVWASDLINIVSEYRTFILDNQILDCRRYKGEWKYVPDFNIINESVNLMKSSCPRAYCLDFGVLDNGKTVLIEMNEGFSFGHYGLHPVLYARMLSPRWNELTKD